MNFLPKDIENIITDYKNQLEIQLVKQEKEKELLSGINNTKKLNINIRHDIYIPIIKLYNKFNNKGLKHKGNSNGILNTITNNIFNEYNLSFIWKNPEQRHREVNVAMCFRF